jgi:hypothetical protein
MDALSIGFGAGEPSCEIALGIAKISKKNKGKRLFLIIYKTCRFGDLKLFKIDLFGNTTACCSDRAIARIGCLTIP